MSAPPLENIVIVLVGTQHPGNIGSAARAMLVMGLTHLRLVRPHHFPDEQADAMASGAVSILRTAKVYDSLEAAVEDCAWVVGTSARPRYLGDEPMLPDAAAPALLQAAAAGTVALVFGCERTGLTNEQLDRCHRLTMVPANPEYSSLNLAAAVQIYGWELRKAAIAPRPVAAKADQEFMKGRFRAPTMEHMEQFFEHLERVLLGTGFIDPSNPRLVTRRLRTLFNRARPDLNELNILRGILTSVEKPKRRTRRGRGPDRTPPKAEE
ncbi:MAG: tRNA (cytidine/uridine-2-O-)-methyltransferase TrmJ [Hydrocarboniphaga sp.]|uniref:RNA methyltransferase n=1 Tax=Hydrocarboniphaga sp. TaxID=2033016 RepID=UPI00261313DC|nr:RNA methyltransferase [Hydrocarboniphaga sp.]MDB5968174.1 tRNA (cytidine/uridine-2-O-)-methyltransferase TrmJ [Hydrocarboniphaga sp.]